MTLCAKAALKRQLVRVPAEAAAQLETLPGQCQEEQAVQALTLLNSASWVLAIRASSADGQRTTLKGILRNTGADPLFKAMCLALTVKAELTMFRSGNNTDSGVESVEAVPPPSTAAGTAAPTQTRGPPTGVPPQTPLPEPPQVLQPAPSVPALPLALVVDRNIGDTAAGASGAVAQVLPGPSAPLVRPTVGPLRPRPPGQPLVFPPAPAPSVPSRAIREMNVSESYNNEVRAAADLERVQGVGRLIGVSCNINPEWNLQLLRLAAPTLEELRVRNPREDHLRAIHAMPRLRDLHVAYSLPWESDDIVLPAIPPENDGLRFLRAYCFPPDTLQSLLRANRRTLEVLELSIGMLSSMASVGGSWLCGRFQLLHLVNECDLEALTRLVLFRVGMPSSHDRGTCEELRRLVLDLLPRADAAVLCDECDRLPGDRVGQLALM
ncbi:uncharacterized protein LOC113218136 [Frankliniella occidentalis]|uniref:Uncharacterized protein LOC113218136 n=1 Tax=Frankliniella occidentalis TaxID=133901 RepID=A0A6J1TRJ6_FRAOC|nr:uncharacterized protein LOC113218136 [Frankliniella occidentalis]